MLIESTHALIDALRGSRLFSPEQLETIVRELGVLGDDAPALMRHILHREWMSLYQLRKVLHGKAEELHLGPYILTDKLAEGGMGKVYRARRIRDGREAAIKIIRPILLANPVIRRRYEREVAAALTLRHPNIVEVFDAGEVDGRTYLAMEFVDGVDLSRLVKQFRVLEVAETCEYGRQSALGLHHAHKAGFVHRDIKPSNIVVSGERHIADAEAPAVVKILDMGLIRSVGFEQTGAAGINLTRSGTVVGTPDYMAPEQAKNSSGIDQRADLYSLGCTLYFLLAGQPPFPEGNAIEKIIKHQTEAPLPLQALRPDVPTPVAEVIARLMAKSPADRYQSALEVANALAPLAGSREALAPTPVRVHSPRREQVAGDTDHSTTTPVSVDSIDHTPEPSESTRRRLGPKKDRLKKQSLSSLHELPSSDALPVPKLPPLKNPVPQPPRNGRGGLIALGAFLVVLIGVAVWMVLLRNR